MGCFSISCFKPKFTQKKCQHCRCKNCPQNQQPKFGNEASVLKLLAAAAIATDSQQEDRKTVNLDLLISELKNEGQIKDSDEVVEVKGEPDSPTIEKHVDAVATLVEEDTLVEENTVQEVEKKCEGSTNEGLDSDLPSVIPDGPHALSDSDQELVIADDKCIGLDLNDGSSGGYCDVQESSSSYDSLFSLSIDSRRQVSAAAAEKEDREVMSPLKQQLQPIGNGETNSVGSKRYDKKSLPFEFEDKENVNIKEKQIMLPSKKIVVLADSSVEKCGKSKSLDNVSTVETSLSSWLVESLKSPHKTTGLANSPDSEKNYAERRILGEVSPLEHKRSNEVSPTAQSTPSCGTNGCPSIGTVGSYWQQIGRVSSTRSAMQSA